MVQQQMKGDVSIMPCNIISMSKGLTEVEAEEMPGEQRGPRCLAFVSRQSNICYIDEWIDETSECVAWLWCGR
jgi:hypothetical protein